MSFSRRASAATNCPHKNQQTTRLQNKRFSGGRVGKWHVLEGKTTSLGRFCLRAARYQLQKHNNKINKLNYKERICCRNKDLIRRVACSSNESK